MSEEKLLLGSLITLVHVMDTESEEAVSWYEDDMDSRTIIKQLVSDPDKREERLTHLVCTLKQL